MMEAELHTDLRTMGANLLTVDQRISMMEAKLYAGLRTMDQKLLGIYNVVIKYCQDGIILTLEGFNGNTEPLKEYVC